VSTAEVKGTVTFKGRPLPGGRIRFLTATGGWTASGIIDENGHYQVKVPLGDVAIAVDNRDLRPGQEKRMALHKEARLKRPDAPPPEPLKGKYVEIPSQYYNPDRSGLTYKVIAGSQSHDIPLE
jgi:hypothetical protein